MALQMSINVRMHTFSNHQAINCFHTNLSAHDLARVAPEPSYPPSRRLTFYLHWCGNGVEAGMHCFVPRFLET
eukprot:2225682-Amphidinium_carterae.1